MEHQDILEEINFGDDVITSTLRDDVFERVLYIKSAFVDAMAREITMKGNFTIEVEDFQCFKSSLKAGGALSQVSPSFGYAITSVKFIVIVIASK